MPEIPYDRTTAQVKTINLPTPYFPDSPTVVLASDLGQSFGLVGAIVDASMQSNRDEKFIALLKAQNTDPKEIFNASVREELAKEGFTVVPVDVTRKGADFLKSPPDAPEPADAYLDIVVLGYGYQAAGIQKTAPYRPFISLKCKLIRTSDKAVLMQDAIMLNPVIPAGMSAPKNAIQLSPDPQYTFADFDALTAQPKAAADGERSAVSKAAGSLTGLLQ